MENEINNIMKDMQQKDNCETVAEDTTDFKSETEDTASTSSKIETHFENECQSVAVGHKTCSSVYVKKSNIQSLPEFNTADAITNFNFRIRGSQENISESNARIGDGLIEHRVIVQKPIIPLPPLVEQSDYVEDIMFEEYGTLFRWNTQEHLWDTRGKGYIKIVFNPEHNCYRVVMHHIYTKILLINHRIDSSVIFKKMKQGQPNCMLWNAPNFAGVNQEQRETLSVRFDFDIYALKFKQLIEDILKEQNKKN